MASKKWSFSKKRGQYRDKKTGRFVSPAAERKIRDDYIARRMRDVDKLSKALVRKKNPISVQQWERDMRKVIDKTYTVQYALGKGGRNAMEAADREVLKTLIKEQYTYLRGFAQEIAAGELSEKQIAARARMYQRGGTTAFERGHAANFGLTLPGYPGVGTVCLTNCRCTWDIADKGDEWHATWLRHASDSCNTCINRASTWAPYIVKKTQRARVAA